MCKILGKPQAKNPKPITQAIHDRLGGMQGMQKQGFFASCGPVSGSAHAP